MKKYIITGFFNIFIDFLENLEEQGIDQDSVLKLYGGTDGKITLVESSLNVFGYAQINNIKLPIKGRILNANQFQLYICSKTGKVYTCSIDANLQDINCGVYYCEYLDSSFDELLCASAEVKVKQNNVNAEQFNNVYNIYKKLFDKSSNLYKLHADNALSSEYFILQDYGLFTDSLQLGELLDNSNAQFIPIYNICCECLDKVEQYVNSLNLSINQSFTVSRELINSFAEKAVEKRNLNLTYAEKKEIISLINQIFEQDDIQADSITLGTARVIMQSPLLQQRSSVSVDTLIANCLYVNTDEISEIGDVINAFIKSDKINADEVISNTLKNQFDDYQISIFIDCYDVILDYLDYLNYQDYQGFLQDIKFLAESIYFENLQDNEEYNTTKNTTNNINLSNEETDLLNAEVEFVS